MDSTTLLTIAIVALSTVLVGVGLYAVIIMRQLQKNLSKVEKILGHVDSITTQIDEHVIKPSSSLAGVLAMLKEGTQIVEEIRHLSTDTATTAKVIGSEAKSVAQVVREEVAPAIAAEVREVVREVTPEIKETVHQAAEEVRTTVNETTPQLTEIAHTVGEESRATLDQERDDATAVVDQAIDETQPTWQDLKTAMESRGVSTEPPRRKFYRRH